MKKNQMEVMREARRRALDQGVMFHTINLKNETGKKGAGNIIVAYKKVQEGYFPRKSTGYIALQLGYMNRAYIVQCSFCSPNEKNPSRTFGEGQAALRFFNASSALVLRLEDSQSLTNGLRSLVLYEAIQRNVLWLRDKTLEDLV